MKLNAPHWILTLGLAAGLAACDAIRPVSGDGAQEKTVEVAVFEGGYGIGWHEAMARRYTEEHRGAGGPRIDLWGDPRLGEKIKPRLLRGNPPDLLIEYRLPIWLLIATGKLESFNAALDRPAYGSDTAWRDLFVPGTLDTYTADGVTYAIPSAFGAWACWYDARLFSEHGWKPPRTWRELDGLCKAVRKAGIAPLAFQGKYAIYAWYTWTALIQRCGGLAAVNRINAMEPGAFEQPEVIEAARLMQDLAVNHFQKGAMAMTHTESQLQFVNNRAAMIFCGLWLYNEMKDSTPPEFEMRCFTVPAVENGKGNPALFMGAGSEYLFVPSEGRHPQEALDFARYLVSTVNAPGMAAEIGVISPLIGATPRDRISPAMRSALDMIEAGEGIFSIRLDLLLLEWKNQVMIPAMAQLLRKEVTPEEFCAALEAGVKRALENPDLVVPIVQPYDPNNFGEPV